MDDEVIFGQIDYIEEQVEFLIELCNSLKAENAEMKIKLESLEVELNEKADAERNYTEQKENIRNKIDSLMSKLNTFIDVSP